MDDPWDLNAVIRFCTSSANSNSSLTNTNINTSTNSNPVIKNGNSESPLDCLASLTFDDDDGDIFSFPNLSQPKNNGWQELQDSYIPFLPNNTSTTTITTSSPVAPNNIPLPLSTIYNFGGLNRPQLAAPLPPPPPPPFTNPTPFNLLFNNSIHQPLQHAQHHECQPPLQTPVRALRRGPSPPAARSRKKKNVLKRQVMHVSADNLSNDVWAWRKYGQKPIKGSPYPRNYYRCSSSKGCSARKQVERSSTEPNMFIVSYAGNHDHPRPTHRNSLAGSTRNRFSASQKATIEIRELSSNEVPAENKGPAVAVAEACSSPVLSATSLSPTTPLSTSAASVDHTAAEAVANEKPDETGGDGDDYDYDNYDDILIPNLSFNEDMIKDFQELSGGSHSPDSADNFSPWSIAEATGDGGR